MQQQATHAGGSLLVSIARMAVCLEGSQEMRSGTETKSAPGRLVTIAEPFFHKIGKTAG